MQETKQENPMRKILLEKITLNCGTGGPGPQLEKSLKLLEKLSGMKPTSTKSSKRIPTWSVRPGLEVGCRVTIRGKKAEEILKTLLAAKRNQLKKSCFDKNGSFGFGIHEYLDIPSIEYDPDIGIIGFEIAATLQRKGFRIKRRSIKSKKIPQSHKIEKEEAMEFMKNDYGVELI
jgi:large subunit ribosomal protein L5